MDMRLEIAQQTGKLGRMEEALTSTSRTVLQVQDYLLKSKRRMSFDEHLTKDARLVILRELAKQTDKRLNETLLTAVLDTFGHRRTRDWVRTQLRILADLGAVSVTEAARS